MMMSSSRDGDRASRRPSSSTRRLTVSLAWVTAPSRMCDSTSGRILKVTAPFCGALHRHLALELFRNSSLIFASSAGSTNVDVDDRNLVAGLLELDLLVELGELFDRRRLVAGVKPRTRRELLAHLVVVAVALVLDRLVDVDRVDEPEAALEVEAGTMRKGTLSFTNCGQCILPSLVDSSVGQTQRNAPSPIAATKPVLRRQPKSITGRAHTSAQTVPRVIVARTQKTP